MRLNRYTYALAENIRGDTDFTLNISVGDELFICRFLWSIVTQEQYDEFEKVLKIRADTNPLSNGTDFDRSYDWLDYITPLASMSEDAFTEWYRTQDVLPQNWRGKDPAVLYDEIVTMKAEIAELNDYRALLRDSLNWQVEVHRGDDVVVTTLRLGGWTDYDTGKAFRFVAPGYTTIGKDELQYVTMEFDINE